ncbi:MAG: HAD family phosphatase [Candidatus Aenigmarchaeota archaeon]|nr:HAD family phosphatase [Candidatus Aenigmarchaeota archaeon]
MIKTMIFDLGGVILTNDWSRDYYEFLKEFSHAFSVTVDNLHRGWKAHYPFFDGKITEEEFWNIFLKKSGAREIDTEKAKVIWRKHQKSLENMFSLLKKLKKKHRLAVLTNLSKEWTDFKRERFRLDEYFDLIISSGYIGVAKPHHKIYELILKKLENEPRECLFIDDREKNLLPARELGMKIILFTGQEELERKLREIGAKF